MYHNAGSEIQERTTSIESIWYRIEQQVEHLKEACGDLAPEFIRLQDNLLIILISKLSVATAKLDTLFNGNKRKLKYVFIKKKPRQLDPIFERMAAHVRPRMELDAEDAQNHPKAHR